MKPHWTKQIQLASDLLKQPEVDQNAETVKEIAAKIGMGDAAALRKIKVLVAAGKLEKVLKQVGKLKVPAYRIP